MTVQEMIRTWVLDHKEEMLEDLMELMRIDSSLAPAEEGAPFGPGARSCFDKAAEIIRRCGFAVTNYDYYALAADFSDREKKLDVLCHLDVVPGQEGWQVTDPFTPRLTDGRLYGRGAMDDKGPAIASLYAMRAIRELDLPMNQSIRLILGGDEETGSADMDYYYARESYAPATISPDSSFPVVNIEKGIMAAPFRLDLTGNEASEKKLPEACGTPSFFVRDIQAGIASNMIPSYAKLLLAAETEQAIEEAHRYVADRIPAFEAASGLTLQVSRTEDDLLLLECKGISSHASTPEAGKNALTGIMAFVTGLPLGTSIFNQALQELHRLFPYADHYGAGLGVAQEDSLSGKLTLSFTVLQKKDNCLAGRFDSRIPLCATRENSLDIATANLQQAGFTIQSSGMFAPHHIPEDSKLVQDLLDSYQSVTGIRKKPLAIGGCTYIHGFPNAVAFGCMEEETDNHIHAQDEFIDIDHLFNCVRILVDFFLRA